MKISQFGAKVLQGRHNVVRVNGVNDWVGGVQLDSSSGSTWFREGENLKFKSIVSE